MAGSFVGIDIGNGSCKLAVRDDGIRLVSRRLPDNMMDGDVVSPAVMAEFLGRVRREERVRERRCAMVLAESNAFFRHVTMPPMTVGELRLNLPHEFRDFIDGDPADYAFDYAVDEMASDDSGAPVRMELYAAATRRDFVEARAGMLRRAGFRLRLVQPMPVAYASLLRSHAEECPADVGQSVALVDIGYANVSVTLFRGDRYQASKIIEAGCRELDEAIADLKGVDRHMAGTYKNANFEGVLDAPACQAIYDRLCVDVGKVVNFYNFSNPGGDVERMYLLGGGAEIPQLVATVRDSFPIPVDRADALLPPETRGQANASVCALAVAGMLAGEEMRRGA